MMKSKKIRSAYDKDMYDLLPPYPTASKPLDDKLQGGKNPTNVAPEYKMPLGEGKKSYGKKHPYNSIDDLRKAKEKL